MGLIDRRQFGALKDLVIMGDPLLSSALDKFVEGEPGELEDLIRSGVLDEHPLDLVEGLDEAFINMPGVSGNRPRRNTFDFDDMFQLDEEDEDEEAEGSEGGPSVVGTSAVSVVVKNELPEIASSTNTNFLADYHQDEHDLLEGLAIAEGLSWSASDSLLEGLKDETFTTDTITTTAGSDNVQKDASSNNGMTLVQAPNGVCKTFEGKVRTTLMSTPFPSVLKLITYDADYCGVVCHR